MRTLEDFYQLRNAEDYFDFFEIVYDKALVNVKRFHIMKEYGTLIKKGMVGFRMDEAKLLDFLKFSLLRVYADYKNGHAPRASEAWEMFKDGKPKGCLACVSSQGGSCDC